VPLRGDGLLRQLQPDARRQDARRAHCHGISINAGSFGMLNVGIALFSCVMPVFRSARLPVHSGLLTGRCALIASLHEAVVHMQSVQRACQSSCKLCS